MLVYQRVNHGGIPCGKRRKYGEHDEKMGFLRRELIQFPWR
jgi:hypothetical protein